MGVIINECIRKILLEAARVMRENGLARGMRTDYPTGAHCLLGAIDVAALKILEQREYCTTPPFMDLVALATKKVAAVIPDKTKMDPHDYCNDRMPRRSNDDYNSNAPAKCAWWNNMMAEDAEAVATKLEIAAERL